MKFDVGVLCKKLLGKYEFHENQLWQWWECKWYSVQSFHICWLTRVKFCIKDLHTLLLSSCKFHENWWGESHTLLQCMNGILFYFHIPFLIWMKFSITYLHVTLLNISEFCENLWTEGRTFLMGINEITFMHVLWNYKTF